MKIMYDAVFKIVEDGTVFVRLGSQTNCGGITQIQVRIEPNTNSGIQFAPSESESNNTHDFCHGIMAGMDMPTGLRSAVFAGANEAYLQCTSRTDIKFTLMNAYVDMIAASDMMFKLVGEIAVSRWYESQSNSGESL